MNPHLLLATIWLFTACAFAQPAQNAGPGAEREAAREQRRADLRTALKTNRPSDVETTRAYDAPPPARHLTARELAEMRQQLRQQQAEVPHFRP
jgi:TolA-binding protein